MVNKKKTKNEPNGYACIYSRVSTVDQSEEGHSLDAQYQECKRYIDYKQYKLVGEYSDKGISGTCRKRQGLRDCIDKLDSIDSHGKPKVIVFYSLSRLSRDICYFTRIYEELKEKGIVMASISENIDMSGASGKMIMMILSTFSDFEREQISERTKMVLKNIKEKEKRWIGRCPYGFRIRKEDGKLVVVPEELEMVNTIFFMREKYKTPYQKIADELTGDWSRNKVFQLYHLKDNYKDIYPKYAGSDQLGEITEILNWYKD